MIKKFIILFFSFYMTCAIAEITNDNFNLQNFLNDRDTYMFITKTNFSDLKLFSAEKFDKTPFDNHNIDQANQFMIFFADNSWYEISRSLKIIDQGKTLPLYGDFSYKFYSMAIYPIKSALKVLSNDCNLENIPLTNISFNLPSIQNSTISYVFSFENGDGTCSQSVFDTFTKKSFCNVTPKAACYY